MKSLFLLLVTLYAAIVLSHSPPPHEFCANPNDDEYAVIQDPFYGDRDIGQPGIFLHAAYPDAEPRWFMIYQNGIDFRPYRAIKIPSNATVFIDITTSCHTFAGRLVRGTDLNFDGRPHNLGTWAQFNWAAYPRVFGGVSVIEGNDGPMLFQSEDPRTPTMGLVRDIIPNAPNACRTFKDSGGSVLKPTDKLGQDLLTRAYTESQLDYRSVSISNNYTAAVQSHNGRVHLTLLYGSH